MAACELISLTGDNNCPDNDGGIYTTMITDCTNIVDVIFNTEGQITNFVMASLGQWSKYEFDVNDDTAFYNQTQNDANKTVSQQAFFKFGGLSQLMTNFADGIKDCCCLVAVHYTNSSLAFVQGIDRVNSIWKKSFKYPKAKVNILTDTSANQSRCEITIDSTGKTFSKITTLTIADLEAL